MGRAKGQQIVPQSGFESAYSDLLVYSLVSLVREKLSVGIKDLTAAVWELK